MAKERPAGELAQYWFRLSMGFILAWILASFFFVILAK